MSHFSSPTVARYRLRLAVAGASVTLVGGLGSLGEAAEYKRLWLASCAVLIGGAVCVLWLTLREHAAAAGQYRRDTLEAVVTIDPARVPRLEELSAYDLGTDPEALGSGGPTPYLAREKDGELDEAIARARCAREPSMVVLRGPSKSGKSRALYESAKRNHELRGAYVLAPRDRHALARLLDDGPPLRQPAVSGVRERAVRDPRGDRDRRAARRAALTGSSGGWRSTPVAHPSANAHSEVSSQPEPGIASPVRNGGGQPRRVPSATSWGSTCSTPGSSRRRSRSPSATRSARSRAAFGSRCRYSTAAADSMTSPRRFGRGSPSIPPRLWRTPSPPTGRPSAR